MPTDEAAGIDALRYAVRRLVEAQELRGDVAAAYHHLAACHRASAKAQWRSADLVLRPVDEEVQP